MKADITGEREVTFRFDSPGNRELPLDPRSAGRAAEALVGSQGCHPGAHRNIAATTLEPPLGFRPYRIKRFDAGAYDRL